jgi:hypothetical protein
VLSVQTLGTAWDGLQTHAMGTQGQLLLGATAGWRMRFGDYFVEAAAGGSARYRRYDVQLASAQPVSSWSALPNLSAAAGLQF